MHLISLLLAQAAVAAGLPPVTKPCGPVAAAQTQAADQISAAVRLHQRGRFAALAASLHGEDESTKRAREATLLELLRWDRSSESLRRMDACTEKDRTVFRYANELTEAVDELRLTFDGDRVKRVTLAPAIRALPSSPNRDAGNPARELDRFVGMLASRDLFSGVVLISRNGQPLYQRAFGFADVESRRPNRIDTMFNLASTNKMFTAVAIMRLIEDGRLSLSTTLGEVLPKETSGKASQGVRIDQLLTHTSGLNSSYDELSFVPGSSYSYSSFGFVVLGSFIEAVSKLPYENFVRLHVLGPAGMARTGIYGPSAPVPWLSTGYITRVADGSLIKEGNPLLHTYAGNPAGGFWSSAPELQRFADALRTGRLLKPANVELMRRAKPELGAPEYGFGVMRWRAPGVWGHGGDLPGTDADLEIDCDAGTTIIVLANRDNVNAPVLAKARSLFFTGKCDF